MALSRSQKQDLIQQYESGLALAPHAFLVSYQGISVPQDTELRRRIRGSGGEYLVVKNTLACGRSKARRSKRSRITSGVRSRSPTSMTTRLPSRRR
ncbi:MAG: 50S ribosomal protein L10 [Thermoanaerobaculia bacterium]|nr:50S ribosomal protein L10 [Thermoanaerobaculia bacterium]